MIERALDRARPDDRRAQEVAVMHRTLRWLVCVVVAVSVASVASVPALARPTKVAMTQIADDTTGLWMAMEDALDDAALELVPTRHVTHVIERLGLDEDLADRDIKKLAAELGVDVLVEGVFEPHSRQLRFTLFANGKRGKPFNVAAGNAGSDAFRKRVHTTMIAKLAAAMRAGDTAADAGATASDDARSTKSKKAGKQASPKDSGEPIANASESARQAKNVKRAKDAKSADDVEEIADASASAKQAKKTKDARDARDARDAKKAKDVKDARDAKDAKDANANTNTKNAKNAKNAKGAKGADDDADDDDDDADDDAADDDVVVIADDDSPKQAKNAK
jgi:hypothetical protein